MADPQRVADQAHDIAKRLISLDPIEYNSVINQYFENNVTSTSRAVLVQGVSRIKKLISLQADLAFESHLVGHPNYDTHRQTIHFAFERTYYPPSIPTYIPFSNNINEFLHKQHFRGTWDSELHLNPIEEENGETKLFVTEVGPTKRRNTTYLENIAPWSFLRPILSFLIIGVADLLGFFRRHPFPSEGPITIILAAIAESWAWYRGTPIDRQNYPWPVKRAQGFGESGDKLLFNAYDVVQTRARRVSEAVPVHQGHNLINSAFDLAGSSVNSAVGLAGASVDSAKTLVGQAFDTAGSLEHQGLKAFSDIAGSVYNLAYGVEQRLEHEANQRGLPVDRYKSLAEQNINEAAKWFGLVTQRAKDQTDGAKNKARRAKDHAKKQARDAANDYQLNQVTTDTGNHEDHATGTRTPLGGHNPHHPGAPSYAQAAHPDHTLASYGQTPLGAVVSSLPAEEVTTF